MTERIDDVRRILASFVGWARVLGSGAERPFGADELSRSQLDALFHIAHSPEPVTPSRLAKWLGVTAGAVTQLVDGLKSSGLVEQRPHPTDARSRILVLSSDATATVERFESDLARRLAARFTALDDQELTMLATLLARTDEGER